MSKRMDLDSHTREAKRENIAFLMEQCGYQLEDALAHEEITQDCWDQWVSRGQVASAQHDSHKVS